MSEKSSSSNGIGIVGLLGIVFVTLKLLGITAIAEWSWWFVIMPFWIGLAITLTFIFGGAIIALVICIIYIIVNNHHDS